tara:strand:- start:302 stop:1003 length:702 start_codon:yes stop_codon:yes gene_type:complete
MRILKNYSVHHYYGKDAEKPSTLPNGDFFHATDTTISYRYNENKQPIAIADPQSIGNSLIGWQDFADSTTTEANPLVQSNISGGEVLLTNDNNGTLTDGNTNVNAETTVKGLNDMWSTQSNTLVFKDTGIEKNDIIFIRVHTKISADIISQDFDIKMDFYDDVDAGGNRVFGFQKQIHTETLSAGVFREKMVDLKFFVGESILNGSGTISLIGTKSFEATVIGWNLTIFKIAR